MLKWTDNKHFLFNINIQIQSCINYISSAKLKSAWIQTEVIVLNSDLNEFLKFYTINILINGCI